MSLSQMKDERDQLLDQWCTLMLEYFSLPVNPTDQSRRAEIDSALLIVDAAITAKETAIALLQMKRVAA